MTKLLSLADFANRHTGQTAYVIGSGKTCSYYDPNFFSDKLTVAVNEGFMKWLPRVDYAVTKYHHLTSVIDPDRCGQIVVSAGDTGQHEQMWGPREDFLVFSHDINKTADFSADDWPDEGKLVVSYSSITSALHFAAHLGVSAIVTVGADCGWLDDDPSIPGHGDSLETNTELKLALHFELQNRIVAEEIRKRYNIPVMSMLPFVTPNMEGHSYRSYFGGLNID